MVLSPSDSPEQALRESCDSVVMLRLGGLCELRDQLVTNRIGTSAALSRSVEAPIPDVAKIRKESGHIDELREPGCNVGSVRCPLHHFGLCVGVKRGCHNPRDHSVTFGPFRAIRHPLWVRATVSASDGGC